MPELVAMIRDIEEELYEWQPMIRQQIGSSPD